MASKHLLNLQHPQVFSDGNLSMQLNIKIFLLYMFSIRSFISLINFICVWFYQLYSIHSQLSNQIILLKLFPQKSTFKTLLCNMLRHYVTFMIYQSPIAYHCLISLNHDYWFAITIKSPKLISHFITFLYLNKKISR